MLKASSFKTWVVVFCCADALLTWIRFNIDMERFVERIGVHFQIRDDYQNLESQEACELILSLGIPLTSCSIRAKRAFVKTWTKANSHSL
jgi:hypothetical protein